MSASPAQDHGGGHGRGDQPHDPATVGSDDTERHAVGPDASERATAEPEEGEPDESGVTVDPDAPGRSLIDEDADAVEPNEPA